LRKQHPLLVHGRFELLLPEHPQLFVYLRTDDAQRLLVLCNFSENFQRLPLDALPSLAQARPLIGNLPFDEWPQAPDTLAAWEARAYWLHTD
jgi:oligo-1,6-glucosidase